jgi:hypothetical protein
VDKGYLEQLGQLLAEDTDLTPDNTVSNDQGGQVDLHDSTKDQDIDAALAKWERKNEKDKVKQAEKANEKAARNQKASSVSVTS